jgi:hypothetical protein
VAFALNVTLHEIAHAITGYWLGFNSTVFQMWVNPDSAEAAPWQLAIIALSGPVFSLTVGQRGTKSDAPAVRNVRFRKVVVHLGELELGSAILP